jgi:WD40 repeat protein
LIQESPTLDLANDCSRFVIRHFEIINTSSPHIYHSALVLTPKNSIVQKLYKSLAEPFARVVHGIPPLWDSKAAATTSHFDIELAVWSPCNRFIAICGHQDVDILDSATLQRLQNLTSSYRSIVALAFSPDCRLLTCNHFYGSVGFIVTQDLQTGGVVSAIWWESPRDRIMGKCQITYLTNGNMVASVYRHSSSTIISIYDVVSGVYMHHVDHLARTNLDPDFAPYVYNIWAHGESLRFATPESMGITIWEVGLVPGAIPTEVERLSTPDNTMDVKPRSQEDFMRNEFHPLSYRLTSYDIETEGQLLVWDARRASKPLLHHEDIDPYPSMTFSSDGRFFACKTDTLTVSLWMESPTGYTLVEKFTPGGRNPKPLLSPNGESIVIFSDFTIQLWHTKSFTTTTSSSTFAQAFHHSDRNLILEFLPDRPLAVATRIGDETVTVIDLNSGVPQLTIDTSIPVYGLRSIGNAILVIGDEKFIFWNLPEGNFLPDVRMNIGDSALAKGFRKRDSSTTLAASISPNFQYIALGGSHHAKGYWLEVYCTSTGQTIHGQVQLHRLWFPPGERDIWCAFVNKAKVFAITQHSLDHTRTVAEVDYGTWGCPWGSSYGYKVTDDGWILGVGGKRLLLLPPLWRSGLKQDRVWSGEFLALLHGALPELVVLELEP